eukprot:760632-Hanusia_phi.AAC.3
MLIWCDGSNPKSDLTTDGVDYVLGTTYFTTCLLTLLMVPELRRCQPSSIITVCPARMSKTVEPNLDWISGEAAKMGMQQEGWRTRQPEGVGQGRGSKRKVGDKTRSLGAMLFT